MFVDSDAVGGAAVHGAHTPSLRLEEAHEARHALVLLFSVPEAPEPAEAPAERALVAVDRHLEYEYS